MAAAEDENVERFDAKDLAQTAVGAFTGALIYAYQADLPRMSDTMPQLNVLLIALCTLGLSFLIGYSIGVRRLGGRRMRYLFWPLPLRIAVHYVFALAFSAAILWLLAVNGPGTPFEMVVRRTVVLSLPATAFGSAVDLIGSQKHTEPV